jgi:hypothetical protein
MMTRSRFFAVLTLGICGLAALATLILLGVGLGDSTPGDESGVGQWGGLGYVVTSLSFGGVGSLLLAKVPGNRVGWVLALTGVAIAIGDVTYQYADQVLYGPLGVLPGGELVVLLQSVSLSPTFGLVGLALLLFPDGHAPSPRWRIAMLPSIAGAAMIAAGCAVRPGPFDEPFGSISNPVGIAGAFDIAQYFIGLGYPLTAAGLVLAVISMLQRRRRASDLERQQLKWVAFAAAVAGLVIAADVVSWLVAEEGVSKLGDVALGIALSTLPIAAGFAILRYRLYDIDVVINRTLVYGTLTATLAATYLGSVLVLQQALSTFTEGSGLAVAASTLAVAALFRPVRARIQASVDRRFFRSKYDAAQTLAVFSARLRDQVDLADIGDKLLVAVGDTVQPSHASVWLRDRESTR